MARNKPQQAFTEAIQGHIEASAPCTMHSVYTWAVYQGYGGSKMIKAVQELKDQGIIYTDIEELDGETVTIVNLC